MNTAMIAQEVGLCSPSIGVGKDAFRLRKVFSEIWESIIETESLGSSLKSVYLELDRLKDECSESNWDGYGADPINIKSYIEATRFLGFLPIGGSMPEVSIEPDGEVSFEWYKSPSNVFSVSFGDRNTISYAGLFRDSHTHGQEYFSDDIPDQIIGFLKRHYR